LKDKDNHIDEDEEIGDDGRLTGGVLISDRDHKESFFELGLDVKYAALNIIL
jgi:hypothetical protein